MFGIKPQTQANPLIEECGHMENDILQDAQGNICFASQWVKKVSAEEYKALTIYCPSLWGSKYNYTRMIPECSAKITSKMLAGEIVSIEEYLASVPAEILKKFDLDAK